MEKQEKTPEKLETQMATAEAGADGEAEEISILTVWTLLDQVAGIVNSVQETQQRMQEQQQLMENNIRSIEADILKLSKAHNETGDVVSKLLDKTRKVSTNVKDVRRRVDKQSDQVKKVETKQEELLRKNKFRVVIYKEEDEVPTTVSVATVPKGSAKVTGKDDVVEEADPPLDLSSDEEYVAHHESRAARLRKSGMKRIDSIKKAFSKDSMVKTKQTLSTKVNRIGTRIVTPERREKMKQSGERIKQSSERLKQSISKAAPTKESFKINVKKSKERTVAEGQEVTLGNVAEPASSATSAAATASPAKESVTYTEVITGSKDEASAEKKAAHPEEMRVVISETVTVIPERKTEDEASAVPETNQAS
ncbi:caveolae-associated protein 4 [Protopterus annectens]|uniref:caveolae-associated protein 4 n=1 Tax=Protopterus annectens TaxID=7888 RepID=UPI001CFB1EE1|nr:caveolae-associated protein 4 [Protopterus annectens]